MTLHMDYETRSRVDLKAAGAYQYARDPSTSVLMLGYAENDDEPKVWLPGQPIPDVIRRYFTEGKPRSIKAHNAQFERWITWFVFCPDYELPEPPLEAFYCTAAQARTRALPGKLEDLGKALQLRTRKDRRGDQLIRKLCIPQRQGNRKLNWEEDPFLDLASEEGQALLQEMTEYCATDVASERESAGMSHPLTDAEFLEFCVSEHINDAGIRIDRVLARAATEYADEEKAELSFLLKELTGGKISTPRQFAKLKDWVLERWPEAERYMKRYVKGERKMSLDASARADILLDDEAPPEVLDLVDLVDEAGKASVAKYTGMLNRADPEDDRVRGAYMFSGASQTQRYSSTGLQLHNFPRDTPKNAEQVREHVLAHDLPEGEAIDTLAQMLRPTLVAAPGNVMAGGDLSSIEAVVLPWLYNTGHRGAREVVETWRGVFDGTVAHDLYKQEAGHLYNKPPGEVTGEERQVGKVEVLSLGFGGGGRAFQAMARNYGIKVEFETAERIKHAWRENNSWAPAFWKALEDAAMQAMLRPEEAMRAGRVVYYFDGRDLQCVLPDGTTLFYPFALVEEVIKPWGPQMSVTALKAAWKPAADVEDWPRISLYGGLLAENATQATACRLLKGSLVRLHQADWPVIGHTHDEVFLEVEKEEGDDAEAAVRQALVSPYDWTDDLPLACETWQGERYGK